MQVVHLIADLAGWGTFFNELGEGISGESKALVIKPLESCEAGMSR